MGLIITSRGSDSPWIDSVWTSSSTRVSEMTSVASETWGLVFCEQRGRVQVTVTGPETRTATAPVPEEAVFVGVQFALGTSLRMLPGTALVDSGIDLPDATRRSFRLDGRRWPVPTADDLEDLVDRLARRGLIERDPLVAEVLRGGRPTVTPRTVERRFRAATGLRQGAARQIARARRAALQLSAGRPPGEVADRLDYYDEPHLARALRRYIGRTARQLRDGAGGAIGLDVASQRTAGTVDDLVDRRPPW